MNVRFLMRAALPLALLLGVAMAMPALPGVAGQVRAKSTVTRRVFRFSQACPPALHTGSSHIVCYPSSQFRHIASGLPFSAADPGPIVRRVTGLAGVVVAGRLLAIPPFTGDPSPTGPPLSVDVYFGKVLALPDFKAPSRREATFVHVSEYWLSYTGKEKLTRFGSARHWSYLGDIQHQHMTLLVDSDAPKAKVAAIGEAIVKAENRAPVPATASERVYVTAPHTLHRGKPVTLWVLMAPRWGTYPGPASFEFSLGGSWGVPRTETPDRTESCGGDNVAGQPSRRDDRWIFNWGDCQELGLMLTPRTTGRHSLVIYGYSVPLTSRGIPDERHRRPAPGSGYRWSGVVLP